MALRKKRLYFLALSVMGLSIIVNWLGFEYYVTLLIYGIGVGLLVGWYILADREAKTELERRMKEIKAKYGLIDTVKAKNEDKG